MNRALFAAFQAHPGMEDPLDPALASMIRNLEAKTGRSLDAWMALVRECGVEKHGGQVKFLKEEHGLTHGYANTVVLLARDGLPGSVAGGEEAEVSLFAGKKEGLRPTYDALRAALVGLGGDVEVSPKKSYVSFRRKKQFALAQPSTATRLDLGLNLRGVEPEGRLESADGFNAMCSHRAVAPLPGITQPTCAGHRDDAAGNGGRNI